ncbi:Homeobox domain [Carpediemonas membranifera]|uniref:Homeobox domain n=1 Tax=Carpediemonas membranifera TaxID=201153 RepID=A0A8J6DXH8_9EUKA|nr:Homeobox domain [Carpediemonas membranifera]|eukprot:KAG9390174.1 Homeobox domain [Carpediemonas membranifera]
MAASDEDDRDSDAEIDTGFLDVLEDVVLDADAALNSGTDNNLEEHRHRTEPGLGRPRGRSHREHPNDQPRFIPRHTTPATKLSPEEASVLHACFQVKKYPSRTEFANLVDYTGLELIRIRSWWQNARTRGVPRTQAILGTDIDPTGILNGTVKRFVDPVTFVDVSIQCDLIPNEVGELFSMGILDSLLAAANADRQ